MAEPVSAPPEPDHWPGLMLAAQGGNAGAYRRLLTEMTPVLRRFLKSRLFNPADVDDLTQEILLAIHAARHTYRPEQPFRNWMYGIARHKTVDYFRREGRKAAREVPDEAVVTFLKDPANNPEEALFAKDLVGALARLPEKQRVVLTMTKIDGHSMAEAAQKLGMTENAAKVTAHRGYRKLKEWLVAYGYE
jgi:RNA polymerase sigma-70 factor (ECF subfamily)